VEKGLIAAEAVNVLGHIRLEIKRLLGGHALCVPPKVLIPWPILPEDLPNFSSVPDHQSTREGSSMIAR